MIEALGPLLVLAADVGLRVVSEVGFEIVPLVLFGAARAAGITVETGHHALKFSFGRAGDVLEPGFHPLIPFFQVAEEIPTRARTLAVEAQQVTTPDGLVWSIDVVVAWRVVDVTRAVVEVDDVERALRDALAVSVHDVVATAMHPLHADTPHLEQALVEAIRTRVERWGVEVSEASFGSIAPTRATLRVTQLEALVAARRHTARTLAEAGASPRSALALATTAPRLRRLGRARLRPLEAQARWRAALTAAMVEAGYPRSERDGWLRDARTAVHRAGR